MSVSSILEAMATNAGRGQLARGALIGNTISNIAAVPGQILDDRRRQQLVDEEAARRAEQAGYARNADARAGKDQALQDTAAARAAQEQVDRKAIIGAGLDLTDPTAPRFKFEASVAEAMKRGRGDVARELIDANNKTTEFDPANGAQNAAGVVTRQPVVKPIAPTQASLAVAAAGGDPAAKAAFELLKPPVSKSLQSKSVMLDGQPAEINYNPDGGKWMYGGQEVDPTRVKPIPPASMRVTVGGADNVKEAVAGMKDGSLPPVMPGRASKDYTAILAEARRQGFDLGKANLDWNATQKHVATMNGAQQLRLNQAINSLPDMLDKVDALASQWKGGRFPILNKANLAAAKNGVYGSDVASVANQLDAQIADVTADLGNVYMGGNSPTDHALGLAGKSLNGAWDEKVLHDMVKLAKTNVTIRQNSIKNTGVAGASETNPYGAQPAAAAPVAPAGMMRVVGPNGETGSMPSGNALPPGWKKQ